MSGRGAAELSGGKKRRKRSGAKKSGKRSSKRSKKMGPSFSEQLITLANALQQQQVAGAGKPKKHKKGKAVFQSLI